MSETATTVADVLTPVVAAAPGREALVTRTGRWSYREADDLCAAAAGALSDLGVRSGDRVAATLPNEADIVFAFHGALRLGAVWVGINQALAPPEKGFLLADSGATLYLCDTATAEAVAPRRPDLPVLRAVVDEHAWHAALGAGPRLRDLGRVDPAAPAALAYTSGTTGRPKGVIHSQHNLLTPGRVLVESRDYGPDLRKGDCLPLTIVNMMALTTLLVAQAGGTAVIMDQIHAEGVADWIGRERVTVWNGPPPVLHTLAHDHGVAPGALATLREAWSGGADLPAPLRARFSDKFGVPVVGTYGLSEAPTVVSIDPPDGTHRPGASGQVLPHIEVSVRGEDGAVVPVGEVGEICLGPTADGASAAAYRPPLGYWNRPDATTALLAGGVVHTGDVGVVDGDGWLSIRDRKNLVIVRGGANVYPAEVERVLHAVDGVAASAVVGVADERLGQRVVAAVEVDPGREVGPDEVLAHARSQLARYKVPERIVVVDALPRNAMGKVDRAALGPVVDGWR